MAFRPERVLREAGYPDCLRLDPVQDCSRATAVPGSFLLPWVKFSLDCARKMPYNL
jgi:hypothetical protein